MSDCVAVISWRGVAQELRAPCRGGSAVGKLTHVAHSEKDPRITEQRNPRTVEIDLASPLEIVDLIAAEDRSVPDAVFGERF